MNMKKGEVTMAKRDRFSDEEMAEELKRSQQKAQGIRSAIFKDDLDFPIYYPTAGEKPHWVDIIPYRAGTNDPNKKKGQFAYTYEYWCHTRLGPAKTTVICPTMYGDKCPVCEHREKLRADDNSDWEKFKTKKRNLYNIISYDDKDEEKKGIQIWDISWHYFEKFLMKISKKSSRSGKKETTVLFMSPDKRKGKTITFSIEAPKGKNDYPKFLGHGFDNRDYEIDRKILKQAHVLDQMVNVLSYAEIKAIISGSSSSNDDTSDSSIDWDEMMSLLKECEDMDDLGDFIDDNDLEGELDFDWDGKFKKQFKHLKSQIEDILDGEDGDDNAKTPSKVNAGAELRSDEMFARLEECTDDDDLEELCDDFEGEIDYDFDEDIKFKKQKRLIKKAIEKFRDSEEDGDDSGGDLREELEGLSWVKLKKWVKNNDDLDIDLEDYEKDDMQDLIDDIIDELE
jgi:hypothetical protein